MILDPRLVPWGDVAPGVGCAVLLTIFALFAIRRRPLVGCCLLLSAPVVAWSLILWKLDGHLPQFPPDDAPEIAWYCALAGTVVGILPQWIHHQRLRRVFGFLASTLLVLCLGLTLFMPVGHGTFPEIPGSAWLAVGMVFIIAMSGCEGSGDGDFWPAAEMTPHLVGLGALSAMLVLTGTATVGLAALALCLTAVPAAAGLLFLAGYGGRHCGRLDFAAPLAYALSVFACVGPLYASTDWRDVCYVLAGCVAGIVLIAMMRRRWGRSAVVGNLPAETAGSKRRGLTREIALIFAALIVSSAPAAVVIFRLLREAEASGFYY